MYDYDRQSLEKSEINRSGNTAWKYILVKRELRMKQSMKLICKPSGCNYRRAVFADDNEIAYAQQMANEQL